MKRILLMSLFLFSILSTVYAQDRTVTGKVTSAEDGSPLPGVSVTIKGTSTGTTTSIDGKYSLNVNSNTVLVFSFIGLETQEIPVGARTVIDVPLKANVKQLNELVVTGYGTQEKRDLTGSITTVKGDQIASLPAPSFDQQLAGRSSGVQITVPSGIIGQAPRIRIRGTNSISSGGDPLIVVDNVPIITGNQSGVVQNNPLADINPSDIESFEVLKDGSATAIYGSRAANGVILITTKKGKKGHTQINYDAYVGVSNTFRQYHLLDATQFDQISNEKFVNSGSAPQAFPMYTHGANGDSSLVNTNWQKQIFQTGIQQNHALSIRGGTDKTSFFFSLGYTNQQSAIVSNQMIRYTFRANVDHKLTNWLSVGTSLGLTRTNTIGLNSGAGGLSSNVGAAMALFPNVPVKNPDGSYNVDAGVPGVVGRGNNLSSIDNNYPNIAYVLSLNSMHAVNYRILGSAYAEASIADGLKLRTQIGVDGFLNDDFQYLDPRQGDGFGSNGYVYQGYSPTLRWNWQNTVSYNKVFAGEHKLGFVGGVEMQEQNSYSYGINGSNLSNTFFGPNGYISGTATNQSINGAYSLNGFNSYFARANYAFRDKYLVSLTIRNDGLSSLPAAHRRGTFPGASLGWRVSDEAFFKDASFLSFINDFKLRASYAQVGNVNIGDFPYLGSYGSAQYASQNGISFNNTGNPDLKWETSNKYDVGADFSFLNDRIGFNFDYYKNVVNGLVLFVPTPPSLGLPNNGYNGNVGAMNNQGIEMHLVTQNIQTKDFTWTTDINFSTNHNKVTKLYNNQDITSTYNIVRVGQPVGALYGYQYEGVNPANGNPLYYKPSTNQVVQGNINDNNYYVYNPADPNNFSAANQTSLDPNKDRKILGPTNPLWFGGINNSFTYKNFDLSIFFRFSGGNKIMNVTRQNLLSQMFVNNSTEILGRWQSPENPGNGQVPKLYYGDDSFINMANAATTRFVESGNFLRCQNITLGYTLPKALLDRAKISKLRIYAQVQNAFIVTKYKGIDPEAAASQPASSNLAANTQYGIDNTSNPQQRIYTLGVNLSF